jgi:hypothetical protein
MPITEGLYLGVIGLPASTESSTGFTNGSHLPDGLWILRLRVLEVKTDGKLGSFTARVAPGTTEKLSSGESLFLLRPAGSTTAQMEAVPGLVPLVDYRDGHSGWTPELLAHRATSTENLKDISKALFQFHEKHKFFPPAVVYGSDGKPWHSWRVLILPYLEQTRLYDQYRLDEPWDSPNNEKLLAMMPDCYHDPIYGPSRGMYTHYAAIVGPGCAFRTEPRKPLDFLPNSSGLTGATTALPDFRDGVSATITVGPVSPKRELLWTKPEDITYRDNIPTPGGIGSFAAPYHTRFGDSGMFAFADTSRRLLWSNTAADAFRKLLLIDDGHDVSVDALKPATVAFLDISTGTGGSPAKLIVEPISPVARPSAAPEATEGEVSTKAAMSWIERLGGKITIERNHPSRPVVEVHLGRTPVTDAGLWHLHGLPHLRKLNLWHTEITDAGLKHVAKLVQLEELYLRDTNVTDEGLSFIQSLKQLQRLGLADTGVTDAGLAKLIELTELRGLFLSNTKITGAGLQHLRVLPHLSSLELRGTELTDAGLEQLAGLTRLQSLGLESTRVTDAGLVHLEGLKQLRMLRLADTKVTKTGVERLERILASVQIVGVSER